MDPILARFLMFVSEECVLPTDHQSPQKLPLRWMYHLSCEIQQAISFGIFQQGRIFISDEAVPPQHSRSQATLSNRASNAALADSPVVYSI
jgi:hypothetical protein